MDRAEEATYFLSLPPPFPPRPASRAQRGMTAADLVGGYSYFTEISPPLVGTWEERGAEGDSRTDGQGGRRGYYEEERESGSISGFYASSVGAVGVVY